MKILTLFFLIFGINTLWSQGFLSQNSTYYSLTSEKGLEYELKISLPYNYDESKEYKTVYYLDGFGLSDIVLGAYSILNIYDQQIEDLIFVGISYPGDRKEWIKRRTMDYFPVKFKSIAKEVKEVDGIEIEYKTVDYALSEKTTGGGELFLKFIENKIVPFVSLNYKNANMSKTLIGHSFGGLFAVYSLQTKPELFDNYIIISASLSVNSSEFLTKSRFDNLDNYDSELNVFNSYGNLEPTITKKANDTLTKFLLEDRFKNINYSFKNYENEGHTSILKEAIYDGLKFIHKKELLPKKN